MKQWQRIFWFTSSIVNMSSIGLIDWHTFQAIDVTPAWIALLYCFAMSFATLFAAMWNWMIVIACKQ